MKTEVGSGADRSVIQPKKGACRISMVTNNEDYLITVDDSVESRLNTAVTLFPYGLVRRHGTPPTTGIYSLHEGALGVFDETLREEDYDDMQDADRGTLEV